MKSLTRTIQQAQNMKEEVEEEQLEELVVNSMQGGARGASGAVAETKLELPVEEIIEDYVGSFGFSQMIQVFLVSLAWMFDAQNTLVTIFADGQRAWRCTGKSHSCSARSSMCGLEPEAWEWVGGKKSSTISEWGLICDYKFGAGIPASMFFIGSLIGSAVHGRLADAYLGRKKTVLFACLLTSLTSLLTSLSPNIWVYALLRFSNGFARSGIGICCLVLSTEAVGREWRAQVGQYGFFFFTAGFLSLPIMAYPTRTSWRKIYRLISLLPLLYSTLILPFVSESPRWLAVKGRTKEAMGVLNKLARLNGKKLPKNLSILIPSAAKSDDSNTTKSLWSTRWAVKRITTVMIAGFGVGFVYYGVQLNVENLNFNLYFAIALNALMEIPAVLLGSVLLGFTDRRLLFSLSAYVTGISCILCIFLSGNRRDGKSKRSWSQLTAEAVGFMGASTAFDVLYIYCVELFPTNVRNFAVSMLRQALMLGASVAPLLVAVGRLSPSLSFLIFGALACFSGFLTVWLPETRNAPLYETLEQQETEEKLCSTDPEVELSKK